MTTSAVGSRRPLPALAATTATALGARFAHMGVDALIVEKHDRIGDNWRSRYHSLTLLNEVWTNSLPYMPFPDGWPTFLPKDKLAGSLARRLRRVHGTQRLDRNRVRRSDL
jgi:cation diffusion facilitator CzcD-associated flavoprotein CzcO